MLLVDRLHSRSLSRDAIVEPPQEGRGRVRATHVRDLTGEGVANLLESLRMIESGLLRVVQPETALFGPIGENSPQDGAAHLQSRLDGL
jgi:hypothetical protein